MKHFYLSILSMIAVSFVGYSQTTYTVEVGADGFSPASLNVQQGDQIDFILN